MQLQGSRFLVAGATGVLGGLIARELAAAGARVAVAGRDPDRLRAIALELGAPSTTLDLGDPVACVDAASAALGGLDGLVIATGVVAFGDAGTLEPSVTRELFEVNALGPIGLVEAALGRVTSVTVLSAVVADLPTAGMAAYSGSKAALSAYLTALRRERRRDGLHVLDVRPQHLDTGLETRALSGEPPRLPSPAAGLAEAVVAALHDDRRDLAYDVDERVLSAS